MKHKSVAVALIIVLLFMVLGNSIACTTQVTEYVLTIRSTEGGSVTTPGEGKYPLCAEQGERVNLVATPDAGYRFDRWTGDVSTITDVNDTTTTITVNDDYSITANFVKQYNLTISSTEGGSVTTPGEGTFTYAQGTVVNLVATPDDRYRFVHWIGDVGTIADVNAATTTITVNDDYSITANFKEMREYDLTISSTEGSSVTTPVEGTHTYDEGEVVNLVAKAQEGYQFANWTGDVGTIANVNAATTTITVNDDYSITANFVKQYNLTISSTEGGSVTTPGEGTFTYAQGTVVNLVATPDDRYRFVHWIGDVGTIADVNAASTTITMNDDYSITAKFVWKCICP
jgi:ribosomal protein L21E